MMNYGTFGQILAVVGPFGGAIALLLYVSDTPRDRWFLITGIAGLLPALLFHSTYYLMRYLPEFLTVMLVHITPQGLALQVLLGLSPWAYTLYRYVREVRNRKPRKGKKR